MKLLAVETATGNCSVALWTDGVITRRNRESDPHRQAELLVPLIEEILQEQALSYCDLDALATCTGPGSFTGVRIGLAAMQGLALSLEKPLLGISSLEAMCRQARAYHSESRIIFSALNAGRGECYVQAYAMEEALPHPLSAPALMEYGALAENLKPGCLVAGNCEAMLAPLVNAAIAFTPAIAPQAETIAELATLYLKAGQADKKPAIPLYIRPPDAKKPSLPHGHG